MLATVFCAHLAAQPFQRESFPEGSYSPVTNINRSGYPRVLKDGSVMFRVQAPQALQVQIDLCGTKYDMTKGEGGAWTATTNGRCGVSPCMSSHSICLNNQQSSWQAIPILYSTSLTSVVVLVRL